MSLQKISPNMLEVPAIPAPSSPATGQVLTWNGLAWVPGTPSTGGGGGANGLTYYANQSTAPDSPTTGLFAGVKQFGRTAETVQTTVTSSTLTLNTWTTIAAFVTESTPIDPDVTAIPAGIWDVNAWAYSDANSNAPTSIRARAYIYDGSTLTLLGTSSTQVVNGSSAQYGLSIVVPQTTVALTDRIYIILEAYATANGHTASYQFGDGTPTHCHTSLPLVGGTGLYKTLSGSLQSPASLLVDADVDAAAAIAQSKISGLTSALAGKAATSTTISAGTGLSGGGDLSANRTLAVVYGTTSNTSAQGNDSRFSDSRTPTGSASGDLAGTYPAPTLAAITTAQLNVGSSTQIPVLSVDAKGRVTALSTATAAASGAGFQTSTVRQASNMTLATAGTLTGAQWTFNSPTVTFTSSSVQLVPGMSISATGLTTAVIKSVDSATQVTMSANATGGGGPGSVTVYNASLTQMVTASTATIDGRTIQTGDVILFTAQTATAQNGPWTVSNIGTGFTLTRPSWYTGTLFAPVNTIVSIGTNYGTNGYSVWGSSTGSFLVGSDPTSVILTISKSANINSGSSNQSIISGLTISIGSAGTPALQVQQNGANAGLTIGTVATTTSPALQITQSGTGEALKIVSGQTKFPDGTVQISAGSGGSTIASTSASTYSVAATDWSIIFGAACTVTLPAASSFTGRVLNVKNTVAGALTSASSNVVPLAGGTAGTAILAATAGKWALLQSDGTNWVIMQAN